jgi:hypothetical protein
MHAHVGATTTQLIDKKKKNKQKKQKTIKLHTQKRAKNPDTLLATDANRH